MIRRLLVILVSNYLKVEEFLEAGVLFEPGVDQVLRSEGIYLKIGFFPNGLGYTCHMENQIDTFHGPTQRVLINTIPMSQFNG